MQRIDTPNKAEDLFGPNKHGFRDGNKALGIAPTELNAAFFNSIQEEIALVIEQTGAALNPGDNTQLYTAIVALITASLAPDASETAKGILELATVAEAQALTDDARAITPLKLKNAFQGGNQSLGTNGYQKIPGGLILQWGSWSSGAGLAGQAITFPVAFPNAVLFVAPVVVTTSGANMQSDSAIGHAAIVSPTTSGFTARVAATTGLWFAIGY